VRMVSRLSHFLVMTLLLLPGDVLSNMCSMSFCECEDSDVSCHGEGKEELELSSSSFPSSISTLSLSNMAKVTIKTNTFSGQEDLKELSLEKIEKVVLEKFSYSSSSLSTHITHFKLEDIKQLHMESGNSLDHFPRSSHVVFKNIGLKNVPTGGLKLYTDTMRIEDCDIGELDRESLYSESQTFLFINNKVGIIKSNAFFGSSNTFNFSGNDVSKIEKGALSLSFLSSEISRNTFHSSSGSALLSLGPSPVCVPDPSAYDYPDNSVEYKVVSSPALTFHANYFPKFSLTMLDLPAAANIPLGSLDIRDNQVQCDCQDIQELAILADFDHLDLSEEERRESEFGDMMFKKEFYSSSVCLMENGEEVRLKKFARRWLEVTETEIKCTNPEERKQRQNSKKLIKSDKIETKDTKNALLSDEPNSEKVEEIKKESDAKSSAKSNKIISKNNHSSATLGQSLSRIILILAFLSTLW